MNKQDIIEEKIGRDIANEIWDSYVASLRQSMAIPENWTFLPRTVLSSDDSQLFFSLLGKDHYALVTYVTIPSNNTVAFQGFISPHGKECLGHWYDTQKVK